MKPYSEACERNKHAILEVLTEAFGETANVLEIGSGTGQHAVFFARHLPHLNWQCSDLSEHHEGIRRWVEDEGCDNVRPPLTLNVLKPWPVSEVDGIFSANTAHIMGWDGVEAMFAGAGRVLVDDGRFVLYGPFSYNGRHTSDSNAAFDQALRARDPASGIRDLEALEQLARANGLRLLYDRAMPANNRCLLWQRHKRQA